MKITNNITYKPLYQPSKKQPNFKSDYQVDLSTAYTRSQVLTLGMMMNNFWVNNARYTFQEMRYNGAYGPVIFHVKDARDYFFEQIMKNQNISFKKVDTNVKYY